MYRPMIAVFFATMSLVVSSPIGAGGPGKKKAKVVIEPGESKAHVVKVSKPRHEYTIQVGGTADMDNTTVIDYWDTQTVIGFRNNVSMEIENTGRVPVVNPRVVANDRGRWWSTEEMAREFTRGAVTDQEKALFIWNGIYHNHVHALNWFRSPESWDPVKEMNIYGQCLCGDIGWVTANLCLAAGLSPEKVGKPHISRSMIGHVMSEIYFDGKYRFIESDGKAFYLDLENRSPVSGDEIARDHLLARREQSHGPNFHYQGWRVGEEDCSLLGCDDVIDKAKPGYGYRLDLTLRPGEKLVYRWQYNGKKAGSVPADRVLGASSLHFYRPSLDPELIKAASESSSDIASEGNALVGTTKDGVLVYRLHNPYTLCGGRLTARLAGSNDADWVAIECSVDGKKWQPLWEKSGKGSFDCKLDLDACLELARDPAKHAYYIRVHLASAQKNSARLEDLTLEADLLSNIFALPRLRVGTNKIEYTCETKDPHQITLRHTWVENDKFAPPPPPPPPTAPTFPADKEVVRKTTFQLQWPEIKNAHKYHIQVSTYPDCRLCYCPAYNLYITKNSHGSPYAGLFSPDVTYYWRVRTLSNDGLWGDWSSIWSFTWDGPRVPVDVKAAFQPDGRVLLTWKPNPEGPHPVAFDVYGSDEKGFSISKVRYYVTYDCGMLYVKGWNTEPNFLARAKETQMVILDPASKQANMNKAFYRVAAVDAHGTESGASDYVELPHPWIYSQPVKSAEVGAAYRYHLQTLKSIGDLQHRNPPNPPKPHMQFFEREGYQFSIKKGPKWLSLDANSGVLSGTPQLGDVGRHEVVIYVKRTWPYEVNLKLYPGYDVWDKSAAKHQAEHEQRFTITTTMK